MKIPVETPLFHGVIDMSTSSAAKMSRASQRLQENPASPLQVQKAELIGELAQAMANHFNNIMMAVTGYAELELKRANAKDKRALEMVLANATRATLLIQTLLDFSRNRTSTAQPIELNAVIGDLSELLKDLLGERVDLSLRLDANPSIIHADRVDVQQGLFALLIAARNEIVDAGQITMSTSLVELNKEFIGNEDQSKPGEYVALSLEAKLAQDRARPARDAKGDRKVSLDTVRAIVCECHGLMRTSSEDGVKSTFKLYFPFGKGEVVCDSSPALPRNPAVARTILVVEDDDAVRLPASEFLMMEGFKVLQARTGEEALAVVQQSRSAPDILITDLFMPKMNGHEVAAKLLDQYSDLKIIYMSGDPGRSGAPGAGKESQSATLRKPFRLNVLRDKIHDLLGE
jgi:two-component system, cell cycle sensor histidine kinase and response regulator CckA